MQWHIITGSKGGVGKTLLSLLLLEYHLERKPEEGILVLDLNTSNTDTSAMLLYNKSIGKSMSLTLGESKRKITLRQTYSLDECRKSRDFGVGWPANPFELYGYNEFVDLLSSMKNNAEAIANKLQVPPVQSVIIDTNYHFCNLFPEQDELYQQYGEGGFKEDTMTVWFLWVYRQLSKLMQENEDSIMRRTASTIERQFIKEGGIGPIVHTYTPVGLLSQLDQNNWWGRIFSGQTDTVRRDLDHTIIKLEELERFPVGKYIGFSEWLKKLQEAKTAVSKGRYEDPHLLFVNILNEAVRQIDDYNRALPINIFPLSVYQSALEGYTDKEREDAVAALREIKIYRNFSRLLDRKYESFLL
jgi:hypothetical protein